MISGPDNQDRDVTQEKCNLDCKVQRSRVYANLTLQTPLNWNFWTSASGASSGGRPNSELAIPRRFVEDVKKIKVQCERLQFEVEK